MSWIRRHRRAVAGATGCDCRPPRTDVPAMPPHIALPTPRPDGLYGDLWQCDECGTVWRVGVGAAACGTRLEITWVRASIFVQWRYRRRETDTEHIGEGLRTRIADAQKEKP